MSTGKPMERTQIDGAQSLYSDAAALTFEGPDATDITRQEFKDEADVNQIMARFGFNLPTVGPANFAEVDWSTDLQAAFEAKANLQDAYDRLPAALKAKYPGWVVLLQAMARGEVKSTDFKGAPAPTVGPTDTPLDTPTPP